FTNIRPSKEINRCDASATTDASGRVHKPTRGNRSFSQTLSLHNKINTLTPATKFASICHPCFSLEQDRQKSVIAAIRFHLIRKPEQSYARSVTRELKNAIPN
ncbi:MAG: hypothetical protein WC239_08360, partial [Sphaerochaetaceae bacterium]